MDEHVARVIGALRRVSRIGEIPLLMTGMHKGEFAVLSAIGEHWIAGRPGQVTTSGIAKELGISPASVSQVLKTLGMKGYIRRSTDEQDRRVVRVELTDKGRDLSEEMDQQMETLVQRVLDGLGEQDSKQFVDLFERASAIVAGELVHMRAGAGSSCVHRKEKQCASTSGI